MRDSLSLPIYTCVCVCVCGRLLRRLLVEVGDTSRRPGKGTLIQLQTSWTQMVRRLTRPESTCFSARLILG